MNLDTIKDYMRCVHIHYHTGHGFNPPWYCDSDSDGAQLLRSQTSFGEKQPLLLRHKIGVPINFNRESESLFNPLCESESCSSVHTAGVYVLESEIEDND